MKLAAHVLASLALASAAHAAPMPGCGTARLAEALPRPTPASLARAAASRRSTPVPHQVGDQKEFWAWDLGVMPPGFRRVTATCRVVTDGSYLFVEDELAANGKVTAGDVAGLDRALHDVTPMYSVKPSKGILELEVEHLGTPPDTIDGDPRVYFLVLRLDEFNGMGFDGFFNAFDQLTEQEAWDQYQQHSNEAEVLYLNGDRGDIAGAYMRGVLAHELSHLIGYAYDQDEQGWFSEAQAEGAMQLTGYYTDINHVRRYATRPESPLVREQYADYGAGFLFLGYLRGLLGDDVFGAALRDPGHGTASVEGLLSNFGKPGAFEDLHAAWAAANLWAGLGHRVAAYKHPGMVVPPMKVHATLAGNDYAAGELAPWGVAYVKVPAEGMIGVLGTSRVYLVEPGKPPLQVYAEDELDVATHDRYLMVVGAGESRAWTVSLSTGH